MTACTCNSFNSTTAANSCSITNYGGVSGGTALYCDANTPYTTISVTNGGTSSNSSAINAAVTSTTAHAIIGAANGANKAGIYGTNYATGGAGIRGEVTAANSAGIYGWTNNSSSYGICGDGINVGIKGLATATNGGTGVQGFSTSNAGTGVYGEADLNGVKGTATGTNGYGVHGFSSASNSYAVYGENTSYSGTGVYGYSPDIGVYGTCGSAIGIGIWGSSPNGIALQATGKTYLNGPVTVTGFLSKSGGGFHIDHPDDPENKFLNHCFVESPEMLNVYRGRKIFDINGTVIVNLPKYFAKANEALEYQLTAIGDAMPNLHIASENNDSFKIAGGSMGKSVSWIVTSRRADKWAKENHPGVEAEKDVSEKGLFLHPELFGYDKIEKNIDKNMKKINGVK